MIRNFVVLLSVALFSPNIIASKQKVNVLFCQQGACYAESMTPLDGDIKGQELIDKYSIKSLKDVSLNCKHQTKRLKSLSKFIVKCYAGNELVEKYAVVVPENETISEKIALLASN